MKTLIDSLIKFSQSKLADSQHPSKEIEKANQAFQQCRANKTSTYISLNGKPYLVTPHGILSYEGTTTVVYSESQQYCEE